MTWLYVFISSIVEGLTEFLPVSSTGHLVLLDHFFKQNNTELVSSFNIFIQAGAILAVIDVYKKDLFANIKLIRNLFISFLPTAVIGLTLYPLIKHHLLNNTNLVAISLIVGGIVIFFTKENTATNRNLNNLKPINSFFIGVFQSLSVIPGTSRALATIVGGLLQNLNLKESIKYSFLLATPTILAATALDLYKSKDILFRQNSFLLYFIVGFFLSYLFAKIVITKSIGFISKFKNFRYFGIYRILIGIFVILTNLI